MTITSFSEKWSDGAAATPRIYILEIGKPDKEETGSVAWLLVERQETARHDERDNSVFEATIELQFEIVKSKYERDRPSRAWVSRDLPEIAP
ncbi:MAG: hypothetical protein JWP72_202 [Massilia sp.]|nr:hypothetical protein [Massilia sp.]